MAKEGFFVQPPMDRLIDDDPWDFFTKEGKELLETREDEGQLVADHCAPECKTFSAARGKPIWTTTGRWIQGPPALRSKPWGLSYLSAQNQIKVRQGNAMAKRSLAGVKGGVAQGRMSSVEHPWNSHMWWTPEALELCGLPDIFVSVFTLLFWR